jgi:hypothetical protein
MSKFINELKRVSQVGLQPMGFKAAQTVPQKPRILLVATLAEVNIEHLADYAAGADAGLLQIPKIGSAAKTIKKICQASNMPWGGWLKGINGGGAKSVVEAGCDFVVFPSDMTLAILKNDVGKILEVGPSLDEGLLKTVNDLPVDAVLIGAEPEQDYHLTWHHLMLFQRCADLLAKPVLASVPSEVTADELQALWEAGVVGVVVAAGIEQPQGRIAELRQVIDKLTFPSPGKRKKVVPLLPYIGGERETAAEEEEEEE